MFLEFEHPYFLWYLLLIPVLVGLHFYYLRHARKRAITFANFEALKRASGKKQRTRNLTQLLVRCLVIASLTFALARPSLWIESETSDLAVMIAIDTSASMAAQDFRPTRLDAAKNITRAILDTLGPATPVGLLSFASVSYINALPTTDLENVRDHLEDISLSKGGGTDIAGAVITATNTLLHLNKTKTVVLISDGSQTLGAYTDTSNREAIEYAKKNHITIHAVGIGTNTGPIGYLPSYYNLSSVYNEATLRAFSNATGGTYLHLESENDLPTATTLLPRQKGLAAIPLTTHFLLLVLIFIILEWALSNTRFITVP
ncbi:VWA domain-containing protein [Candidatus Woesearchaeota archaeon]|nr:MAG: VWA domain-containing protein [Candidatus Woesearchaeota archaeon]